MEETIERPDSSYKDETIWLAQRLLSKGRYKVFATLASRDKDWNRAKEAAQALAQENWTVPGKFKKNAGKAS